MPIATIAALLSIIQCLIGVVAFLKPSSAFITLVIPIAFVGAGMVIAAASLIAAWPRWRRALVVGLLLMVVGSSPLVILKFVPKGDASTSVVEWGHIRNVYYSVDGAFQMEFVKAPPGNSGPTRWITGEDLSESAKQALMLAVVNNQCVGVQTKGKVGPNDSMINVHIGKGQQQ